MAAWCFVCDAPVTGDRCRRCGRLPTVVEDRADDPPRRRTPAPRPVWLAVAVVVVIVLFSLLRAGLGLD